ncbi:MAG TPA: FAD-dependent oxidoreductase [Clostridia bacterium]|nr:FAD-dependent oxidoreductase [Clostridia bacterium]
MHRVFDAVVIGGGIIGLSSAYYLLKSGKRVLLIEKEQFGAGASGACDDMILLQSKKPGISLELALESIEMYRTLSEELETDVEFESRGGMILIENAEQLAVMEEFAEQQRKYGLDVGIIDKDEVMKRQPHVRKGIIASTYSNKDSQVNPLKVMRGYLRKSSGMGLVSIKGVALKEISPHRDFWRIDFENGETVETERIVNAAGAWAPQIGKMVGVDIPIIPKKGQIAVTEQIPPIGETNVWSAEYIVSKLKPEMNMKKNDIYSRLGVGFAFSQTTDGNYLIGSTRENAGFDRETNLTALNILVKQAVVFFPVMKNVNIIRSFAGLRPASEDGKPIIGEVENRKGFYIASGHEGDGIALAPITGKLISDMIGGTHIPYNMEELNIRRFGQRSEVSIV